jgi:hypothetical protein
MATVKSPRTKLASPHLIRSLSLTPADSAALDDLAQDASDWLGWTVSGSALIRALIRYARGQGPGWQRATLFPLLEEEIARGTTWGGPGRRRGKTRVP